MTRYPVVELSLDELEDDPYPSYARLRREAPVAWVPEAGVWFASTFDLCGLVGRGELGFGGATNHPTLQRVFGRPNILTADGQEHDDLRAGVDPPLQPGPVNAMIDALVRPVARHYLASIRGRSRSELMADYFEPVSVEALRRVMGLDELVDTTTLRRWFADLNVGVSNFGHDPEGFAIADRATLEIEEVVRPKLEELRRKPDESMLSHMLWTGRAPDDPRAIDLVLPSLKVILLGGMQEPGHAAGSTLLGLFTRPDQLAMTYADPAEFVPLAIHEGLRWIAPIGAVERQASRDVELGGAWIQAGDNVMTVLGSANRDESRFDDPDTFDLDRVNRTHQAFGNGEHFCAGHFFARQVERIMFEEMLAAMPNLRLDPDGTPLVTGWVFRAPKKLPVQFDLPLDGGRESITVARAIVEPSRAEETVVLRVEALRHEADGIVSIEFADPDGHDLPGWQPGAHVDLWVVDTHPAHYSLCGDPADRLRWKVAVLREPNSRGASAYIHERLRPGMLVHVGLPRNTFPLPDADRYHFVAGGIGVTPIIPLARAAVERRAEVRVTYCGRTAPSMALTADLLAVGCDVTLHADDERGLVDLAALVEEAAACDATIVACGPEGLIDALERLAEQRGVALSVERFAAGEAHRDGDHAFEVNLIGSQMALHVAEDQTILDALQCAGIEVPNVCREGNCGSCETRVLAGTVDHRDVLLTPRQRKANDRMMICVSRAAGATLDLDR